MIIIKQFFICLIIFTCIKNELRIPFKRKFAKELTHEFMTENMFFNTIIANIKIGTPPQDIPLAIKSLEYINYIYDTKVYKYDVIKYSQKDSKTCKILSDEPTYYVENFFGFDYAYTLEDTIQINNLTISDFPFFVATEMSYNPPYTIHNGTGGILGLRIEPQGHYDEISSQNFIDILYNKNIIQSKSFSFKFNEKDEDGELIIDPLFYNELYGTESFSHTRVHHINEEAPLNWYMIFDNVYYGSEKGYEFKHQFRNARVTFEVGVIFGIDIFRDLIRKEFFNEQIKLGNCGEVIYNDFITFYCKDEVDTSKIKPLIFEDKEMRFKFILNQEDLWFKKDGKKYFLIIFRLGYFEETDWTLGKPFLKKYQLVFDKDKYIIGIFNQNMFHKSEIFFIKFFYEIISFCGILAVLFLFYFFWKKKNKNLKKVYKYKAFEMDEYSKEDFLERNSISTSCDA
jgi:hypothetical protein